MTERIHKAKGLEREFVILRNQDVQRHDLSYEAIGMLVYLMSLPTDWVIYVSTLERSGAGRDRVKRIIAELELHGYLYIEQGHDETGKFTANEYQAYAMPEYNPYWQPSTENPSTVKPLTVNQPLQSKDTKKEKKEEKIAPNVASNGTALPKELKPAEYLAIAMGIVLTKADWGNYSKVAKTLNESGVTCPEFMDYVLSIQKIASTQDWKVTVNSLTSNGRVSEYVTRRDKDKATRPFGDDYIAFPKVDNPAELTERAIAEIMKGM